MSARRSLVAIVAAGGALLAGCTTSRPPPTTASVEPLDVCGLYPAALFRLDTLRVAPTWPGPGFAGACRWRGVVPTSMDVRVATADTLHAAGFGGADRYFRGGECRGRPQARDLPGVGDRASVADLGELQVLCVVAGGALIQVHAGGAARAVAVPAARIAADAARSPPVLAASPRTGPAAKP